MESDLSRRAMLLGVTAVAGGAMTSHADASATASVGKTELGQSSLGFYRFSAADLARMQEESRDEALAANKYAFRSLSQATPDFQVRSLIGATGRFTSPWFEKHSTIDHIYYMVDGEYEFKLGGAMTNPAEIKPGYWRSEGCRGYETFIARKGDLIYAPRNIVRGGRTPVAGSMLVFATGMMP